MSKLKNCSLIDVVNNITWYRYVEIYRGLDRIYDPVVTFEFDFKTDNHVRNIYMNRNFKPVKLFNDHRLIYQYFNYKKPSR